MKYFLLSFLTCCCLTTLFAQERIVLEGIVTNNGENVENVHVRNITNNKVSITNQPGEFSLTARAGDTLVLSHVSMDDLIKVLKDSDMQEKPLILQMDDLDNVLDEVLISEKQEINAVTLGILSEHPKIPTPMERKLQTAGDWKPIHLLGLLTGGIQLDPILNAISGRTNKLKRNVEVDKKINKIAFLEYNYKDYMLNEIGISEEEFQLYISYLLEIENLQAVIDSDNEAQIKFFLHDNWISFNNSR